MCFVFLILSVFKHLNVCFGQPSRVAVRFKTWQADVFEEVVLHVEPSDLRVLHDAAEDVSDAVTRHVCRLLMEV